MRSNKRTRLALFTIMLLTACSFGCKHTPRNPATLNAVETDNGHTLNLHVGDELKLSLAENPTTGYKWDFLTKPEPFCILTSDAYVANPAVSGFGGGGAHNWAFRSVKEGTAKLTLGYRRPWQKDTPPAKTFTLTLVVN